MIILISKIINLCIIPLNIQHTLNKQYSSIFFISFFKISKKLQSVERNDKSLFYFS